MKKMNRWAAFGLLLGEKKKLCAYLACTCAPAASQSAMAARPHQRGAETGKLGSKKGIQSAVVTESAAPS